MLYGFDLDKAFITVFTIYKYEICPYCYNMFTYLEINLLMKMKEYCCLFCTGGGNITQ